MNIMNNSSRNSKDLQGGKDIRRKRGKDFFKSSFNSSQVMYSKVAYYYIVKVPANTVKVPANTVKLPTHTVKLPTHTVKLPTHILKLPTHTVNCPYIQ